jgi:hypothetical protein
MTAQLPAIPPGPADTTLPRRALARLALSSAYREAADFAAGSVPTVSDEYGDAYDYVDHAARLVSMASDVLLRAVVYARERGGRWDDIAEALNLTADQARDRPVGRRTQPPMGTLRAVPGQPDAGRHHRTRRNRR